MGPCYKVLPHPSSRWQGTKQGHTVKNGKLHKKGRLKFGTFVNENNYGMNLIFCTNNKNTNVKHAVIIRDVINFLHFHYFTENKQTNYLYNNKLPLNLPLTIEFTKLKKITIKNYLVHTIKSQSKYTYTSIGNTLYITGQVALDSYNV